MLQIVLPGQYIVPTHKPNEAGLVETYFAGKGCTIAHINAELATKHATIPIISATILGSVFIEPITDSSSNDSEPTKKSFMVSVFPLDNIYARHRKTSGQVESEAISINLPQEKDIVLVRIVKIFNKQAHCEIVCVEGFGSVLADSGIGANGELSHFLVPPGAGSQAFAGYLSVASSQLTFASAIAVDVGENFKGVIRSQDVRSTDRDKVRIIDSFKPGDIVRAVIISLGDGANYYLSTARNDLGVLFAKSENGSGDLMFPIDWETMMDPHSGVMEKRKCAKPFLDEQNAQNVEV